MSVQPMAPRLRLGEMLVKAGKLTDEQVERALKVQSASGARRKLGQTLSELGLCSEEDIASALSEQLHIPFIPTSRLKASPDALESLRLAFCAEHEVIPVKDSDGDLMLAMADPFGLELLDLVRQVLGPNVSPAVATRSAIIYQLSLAGGDADPLDMIVREAYSAMDDEPIDDSHELALEARALAAPTVRLVDEVLSRGLEQGASDVHIEPGANGVVVRFRIDGALREELRLPIHLHDSIVARIKVMSDMDITVRRTPQDGHLMYRYGPRQIDFRVSTLPTTTGEKCVLRILGSSEGVLSLEELGFSPEVLVPLRKAIGQPQGCVIITGPTGSGKSSTLLSCLGTIKNEALNIVTIEDPVELELPGVAQVQVNEAAGVTFASGLRTLLRQDPDIIMVGEIRDDETADIAMRASLTGHLLLTTLHANDAVNGVTRLRNIGIDDYLISSSVSLFMAQRLLRRLCPACRVERTPDRLEAAVVADLIGGAPDVAIYGPGEGACEDCGGRRYAGRVAAAEVLTLEGEVPVLIAQGAAEHEIRAAAAENGARSMFETGLDLVMAGTTSIQELLRVVPLPKRDRKAPPLGAMPARRVAVAQPALRPTVTTSPSAQPLPTLPRVGHYAGRESSDLEALKRFCSSVRDLPTCPGVVARLQYVITDPDSDVSEVVEIIQSDPVVAARVLRVANSTTFGMRRQISTVGDAVIVLGLDQIWSLAVATSLIGVFPTTDAAGVSVEDLWAHSLGVSVCARELGRLRLDVVEQASLVGLLHDIGKLILAVHSPEQMGQAIETAAAAGAPLWQVELDVMGFTHADVGAWLLEAWHVPDTLRAATQYHHDPAALPAHASPECRSITALVNIADDAVKAVGIGNSGDTTVFTGVQKNLEVLGLTTADLEHAIQVARSRVPSIVDTVRLAVG